MNAKKGVGEYGDVYTSTEDFEKRAVGRTTTRLWAATRLRWG